jgi:hypothetical protein
MSTTQDPRLDDPTIGRLVADASRDISALVQSEIALAKSELKFSAKAGGIGAAMFVIAGFLGLLIIVMILIFVGIMLIKKIKAPTKTIATAKEIPSALKGDTTPHTIKK